MAVNQKAISAKIDISLLRILDKFCEDSNQKRNAIINKAIENYLGYRK